MEVVKIPTDRIRKSTANFSRDSNYGAAEVTEDFLQSIQSEGLLNPIHVKVLEDGDFDVVAGTRRLTAFRLLQERGAVGFDTIDAVVVSGTNDFFVNVTENFQRRNPNVVQQALAIEAMESKGIPVSDILRVTGFSKTMLTQRKGILDMGESLRQALAQETISIQQANLIHENFEDDAQIVEWINKAATLNTRALKEAIKKATTPEDEPEEKDEEKDDEEEIDLDEDFDHKGTAVILNDLCDRILLACAGEAAAKREGKATVRFDELSSDELEYLQIVLELAYQKVMEN